MGKEMNSNLSKMYKWRGQSRQALLLGNYFENICQNPAPSIRAESSNSTGIERIYCQTRNIPNGVTHQGIINAQYVLSQPIFTINLYNGIIITCDGIISTPRIEPVSNALPKNFRRARA